MNLLFIILLSGAFPGRSTSSNFVPENHPNWKNFDHNLCGLSSQSRIYGGTQAKLGEFPWMALIGFESPTSGEPISVCGGALVNKHYVISAAHCFNQRLLLPFMRVWLGEHNLESEIDCEDEVCAPRPQVRSIESLAIPADYSQQNSHITNDIAVLKLRSPVQLNSFVNPICLPDSAVMAKNLEKLRAYMTGWGETENGTSVTLQKLKKRIMKASYCKKLYAANSNKEVCAKGREGQAACFGDSGGPLMIKFRHSGFSHFYLVGVLSFGPVLCGVDDIPDFYTRITAFLEHILNVIQKS